MRKGLVNSPLILESFLMERMGLVGSEEIKDIRLVVYEFAV